MLPKMIQYRGAMYRLADDHWFSADGSLADQVLAALRSIKNENGEALEWNSMPSTDSRLYTSLGAEIKDKPIYIFSSELNGQPAGVASTVELQYKYVNDIYRKMYHVLQRHCGPGGDVTADDVKLDDDIIRDVTIKKADGTVSKIAINTSPFETLLVYVAE